MAFQKLGKHEGGLLSQGDSQWTDMALSKREMNTLWKREPDVRRLTRMKQRWKNESRTEHKSIKIEKSPVNHHEMSLEKHSRRQHEKLTIFT